LSDKFDFKQNGLIVKEHLKEMKSKFEECKMLMDKQTEMDWENLLKKCMSEMDQAISEHIPALSSVVNQVPEATH
jgi:hypothetical protein